MKFNKYILKKRLYTFCDIFLRTFALLNLICAVVLGLITTLKFKFFIKISVAFLGFLAFSYKSLPWLFPLLLFSFFYIIRYDRKVRYKPTSLNVNLSFVLVIAMLIIRLVKPNFWYSTPRRDIPEWEQEYNRRHRAKIKAQKKIREEYKNELEKLKDQLISDSYNNRIYLDSELKEIREPKSVIPPSRAEDSSEMKNHPQYRLAKKRFQSIIDKLKRPLIESCPSESKAEINLRGKIRLVLKEGEHRLFPEFCLERLRGHDIKITNLPKFDLNFIKSYCCSSEEKNFYEFNSSLILENRDVIELYKEYSKKKIENSPLPEGKIYSENFLKKAEKSYLQLKEYFKEPREVISCAQEPNLVIGFKNGTKVLLNSSIIVNFNKLLCLNNVQ